MKTSIAIFDIDGTLTDSIGIHQSAFLRALETFDFPALETDWTRYRHHSDSAIFSEAWSAAGFEGPAPLGDLERQYCNAFDSISELTGIREIQGAARFLSAFRDSEWIPVFATGSLRSGAISKLDAANILFDYHLLVTASELETREEIVSKAIALGCERLSGDGPDRVVSVGDGLWDHSTALSLGLEFIGVGSGAGADVLQARGARVISDYSLLSAPADLFDFPGIGNGGI